MASQMRQLLTLINNAVDQLERVCAEEGTSIPDLHAPFSPLSEIFRANPAAAESANIISAAALQLEAILTPPHISLYHVVAGHFRSAAIRVCLESHVTEILREAGPKGLHVKEIAKKNGQDPRKLARFMRFLALNHIYREVTPNVFANTRISSMLDTLKPSAEVIANPLSKYDNTPGLAALAGHHLDESFKASAYTWEALSDPAAAISDDPKDTPFALAYNTKELLWGLYARDEYKSRRFNIGMRGVQALQPPDSIFKAYEWKKLPAGSVVVDVGGGLGSDSLRVAREFPSVEVVVQDRAPVIEDAKKHWHDNLPNAKVTFEVQDFFEAQPERKVSIFLVKQILHDWPDDKCIEILARLRAAAQKDTKLLLVENLIPYACREPTDDGNALHIPGVIPHEAPEPLLPNYGAVSELGYDADVLMYFLMNGQDRTFQHINELFLKTGWKAKRVHRESSFLGSVEAIPTGIFGFQNGTRV
ncbi:hypothetical protein H0H93_014712 [Arthromyces matolae]|nr:hypothetical protein H0H93_014712 [Arthromyces matolae]